MKRFFLPTAGLIMLSQTVSAQSVGIGTASPNVSAQLDISSNNRGLLIPRLTAVQRTTIASPAKGLLVYDSTDNNFWYHNGIVWTQMNNTGGASQWTDNGNNIYNNNSGNVGIGLTNPAYKLDVSGSTHISGGLYTDGFVGISTFSAPYKLTIQDGSVALYNSTDLKYWVMNYNSSGNYLNFNEDGNIRMVIENGGNVGIGLTNPAYRLDVSGAIRASGNIQSLGSLSVDGSATINNGGGVAYNPNSGTNLKIVPFTTANFHAVLGPHGSAETTIGLPAGFTNTPRVFVGSIAVTGGTVGELNRVILVLWGCDTNSCNAKIINTDNASVDYNITWNCMAIGN